MNAKDVKKYTLITAIANAAPTDAQAAGWFEELAAIDYTTAFEVWEFKLGLFAPNGRLENGEVCKTLDEKVFAGLLKASETKFRQLFCDSLPLIKLIYQNCMTSCSGSNLTFLINLILSNKLDAADEALRCTRNNETGDFGDRMRAVVDGVLSTYCAKNGVKKAELNKKQSTMLLDHIEKIKGANKAILRQRIKEL